MLILDQRDVHALLPMRECMDVMALALSSLASGHAILPLRTMVRIPDGSGIMGVMPAYLAAPAALGLKVITVYNSNHGTGFDSHQGAVLLFETEHGSLAAIMDASSITATRTAAVSGVATRLLARADAGDLCLIGSGVQAHSHLEAMLIARPIGRVRVWSRTPANARAFVDSAEKSFGISVERMSSAREAVEGADIICTTTSSREPVVNGEWIAPGAHLNVVGSSAPVAREVDSRAMEMSRLFVDRRESTLNEAGDFLIPRNEGVITDDHIIAELGDVLTGASRGRESDSDVTLFKSLGLAVEDVAAAQFVYERALERGAGFRLDLGGRR